MFFRICCLVVLVVVGTAGRSARAQEAEAFTEPYQEIELAVGESGVLDELSVKEGERVQKDEVVARLDTRVLEASLRIAEARARSTGALEAAQAEESLRRKQFQQFKGLREKGHATQRELERAEADYRIAQARLKMAEEEIHLQQLECRRIQAQIERREIRSPIAGIVSEVTKDVGESFTANEMQVMKIVQLDKLRAKFSLRPSEVVGVKAGDQVSLRMTHPSRQITGTVETVLPVMDAKSGTLSVTVVIDNTHEELRSGGRCFLPTSSSASTRYTTK